MEQKEKVAKEETAFTHQPAPSWYLWLRAQRGVGGCLKQFLTDFQLHHFPAATVEFLSNFVWLYYILRGILCQNSATTPPPTTEF